MQLTSILRKAFHVLSILIALFVVMPESIAQSKKGSKSKTTKKKIPLKKRKRQQAVRKKADLSQINPIDILR